MEHSAHPTDRTIPLLDLDELHRPLKDDIEKACLDVIASGSFILGPNVSELEREIAAYCGVSHGIGVASGTDAIHLCMRALDIGPGDEVITSSFTFCATADSILLTGARPVFADIDPLTFNLDPQSVADAITPATKAILPVHLYGKAADMDSLRALAKEHGLFLVEDNAQALGAALGGIRTGALGDLAAISFFPSKNLGCCGDGGMVLTNSDATAARIRSLRAHGTSRKYYSTDLGLNSRLDEIQAAILRVKLPYLDAWNRARRDNATRYNDIFASNTDITVPGAGETASHVYNQYTLRVPRRDSVQDGLKQSRISSAVYYPVPLHLQPLFAGSRVSECDLPHTETACREVISIPVGPELRVEDLETITAAVFKSVEKH
jgi:dTDP-4-amino-4,6-dideoxygalactose transaminase